MADDRVRDTQRWLNATYGGTAGYNRIDEDAITGWQTIYALRRGLQIELGIGAPADGFGPQTTAAYATQIGTLTRDNATAQLTGLVNGALWCKGRYGAASEIGAAMETWNDVVDASLEAARSDLGLTAAPEIPVKLMKSLMSMDAYSKVNGGRSQVQAVQKWLNGQYWQRTNFDLLPVDGVHSRQVQTGMICALQYELGFGDSGSDGLFGPSTRNAIKAKALIALGDEDGADHFVRLFQAALCLNGVDVQGDGAFGNETRDEVAGFQQFMELEETGAGDYRTWCALLVSTGDPDQPVKGFDTSTQLSAAQVAGAKAAGYTHVGRYTVNRGSFVTRPELTQLKAQGLRLLPIHQRSNNKDSDMTFSAGRTQGIEAVERCRTLGLPVDSVVFFGVDYDPVGDSIQGPVMDFFDGIAQAMAEHHNGVYKVGVYGTRNVCTEMIATGRAVAAFVAGMSTGYSGNMGFAMPDQWHYNQIKEFKRTFGGVETQIDHDVVSTRAAAVDLTNVTVPPGEQDGRPTDTGFEVVFEWCVKAEAAIERELSLCEIQTAFYAKDVGDFILSWLRKPTYWDSGSAEMWKLYTPESDDPSRSTARGVAERTLANLSDIRKGVDSQIYELAHMAATCLGASQWRTAKGKDACGLEDVGGWALDLLQVWGSYLDYLKNGGNQDLENWMVSQVGASGAGTGFSYADALADADGWLLAQRVFPLHSASGLFLSDSMRHVFGANRTLRLRSFFDQRFDGDRDILDRAFWSLCDGQAWGGSLAPLPQGMLLKAASADRMPSVDEARACSRALGSFLAAGGM